MADGGMFPWKVQKLNLAPTLSYDRIQRPLKAPKGRQWMFDSKSRTWSLIDAKYQPPSIIVDAKEALQDSNGRYLTPHHIGPEDTFQGICLKYKVKPHELRQANGGFSGTNLNLVPNPLMVPCKNVMESKAVAHETRPLTQSEVVGLLLKECKTMARSEARAYLMLSEWDLAEALENAREDGF